MSYEERVQQRIAAARKREEELVRLERARYNVQDLMYEAEEVLRFAAQRLTRSGLPASMSKAVQKAFTAVSDAVRIIEAADLRTVHPEARRGGLKSMEDAEVLPVARAVAAEDGASSTPDAAARPRRRRGVDTDGAAEHAAKDTEGRPGPGRAKAAPQSRKAAKAPAPASGKQKAAKPRQPLRRAGDEAERRQRQLPLVDEAPVRAPEPVNPPDAKPRRGRRKDLVGVA